jgi:hypothetical protein
MSEHRAVVTDLEGIVNVRCRPPLPEFRAYFEPSRLKQQSCSLNTSRMLTRTATILMDGIA